MPKLKNQCPKLYRDRNQAISWYNGKRHHHGKWGTPEANRNYKRFVATLLESPHMPLQDGKTGDVLVSELAAGFLGHLETQQTDKTDFLHFKRAIGFLIEIYGEHAVNDFSPKKLKVCRDQMVKAGTLCRNLINKHTGRIIRVFAWGVEEEVVQSNVLHALKAVKELRKGEQGTFDNPPRQEVSDDVIRRTLPFMSPTVAAMVQVQRLTGMRPSEVYRMTVGDIDQNRGNGLWYYVPGKHKTEEYIGEKPIPLSKHEQVLIAPYLVDKKASAAVFSPRTAMAEWRAEWRKNRKTKVFPSQEERNRQRAKNPAENVGEFYDKNSYRQRGVRKLRVLFKKACIDSGLGEKDFCIDYKKVEDGYWYFDYFTKYDRESKDFFAEYHRMIDEFLAKHDRNSADFSEEYKRAIKAFFAEYDSKNKESYTDVTPDNTVGRNWSWRTVLLFETHCGLQKFYQIGWFTKFTKKNRDEIETNADAAERTESK